jgi:putative flippase GtrA
MLIYISKIKIKELFLFAISGFIGFMVDVLVTYFAALILGEYLGRIPGFVLAATATWLFNRSITFSLRISKYSALHKEYLHYVSLMVFGLTANYFVYLLALTVLPNNKFSIFISIALGSIIGMFVNYYNSKKYIFNK